MKVETLLWATLLGAATAFGMKAGEWVWNEYTRRIEDLKYGGA